LAVVKKKTKKRGKKGKRQKQAGREEENRAPGTKKAGPALTKTRGRKETRKRYHLR